MLSDGGIHLCLVEYFVLFCLKDGGYQKYENFYN